MFDLSDTKADSEEFVKFFADDIAKRRLDLDRLRIKRTGELIDRRAKLVEDHERLAAEALAEIEAAKAEEELLNRSLKAARLRMWEAEAKRFGICTEYDRELAGIDAELRRIGPRAIDDFVLAMRAELDLTRKKLDVRERPGKRNFLTGKQNRLVTSNARLIDERCAAITGAIAEAEGLKFSALSESEVIEQLDKLRALPEITEEFISIDPVDVSELQRA